MTKIILDKTPIPKKNLKEYWARCVYRAIAEMGKTFHDRSENGMSQEIISAKLQKDKSIISKILRGRTKNLTIKTLSEMSLAMDCDLQIKFVKREDMPRLNYRFELENMNEPNYCSRIYASDSSYNQLKFQY